MAFFECNAVHYNYAITNYFPLELYFENVIHYNYITITITPGLLDCSHSELALGLTVLLFCVDLINMNLVCVTC